MSEPALKLIQPDRDSLLGYESALIAHARGAMVFIAPNLDAFNAMDDPSQNTVAIFPRDGEWLRSHAELVLGMELVFAFTSPEYRVKVGRIVDEYARETYILSDEKTGHDNLVSYLQANDLDLDGLLTLTDYAARYDYHEEQLARANRITATAYEWTDPKALPEREWLYGNHLLRRYVSVTAAQGGMGKSRLLTGEALAMASGRNLFNQWVRRGLKVWIWNLEDDKDELARCIQAACICHRITRDDIAGRLFVDSGRNQELCTARAGSNGVEILQPVYDNIVEELKARKIDVLIVDPFVSSHRVNENDNGMIDVVVKAWARVTDSANCAIELVHHVRKSNGTEVTADSARGGSSIVGAARDVRVLNPISQQEAEGFGIDNPRSYFRAGSDKSNFAPIENAQWYEIIGVNLYNDPSEVAGDSVGVYRKWTPPDPFDDITQAMMQEAIKRLSQGDCKYSSQAKDWGGHIIAHILEIDTAQPKGKAFMKRVLWQWEKNGQIHKVNRYCKDARKEKPFVEACND